jgi:hypothetical protein
MVSIWRATKSKADADAPVTDTPRAPLQETPR